MELTNREVTIIFNALGRLHGLAMDGLYEYHRDDEISELHDKFHDELKKIKSAKEESSC